VGLPRAPGLEETSRERKEVASSPWFACKFSKSRCRACRSSLAFLSADSVMAILDSVTGRPLSFSRHS
jgi:hypothetical protein